MFQVLKNVDLTATRARRDYSQSISGKESPICQMWAQRAYDILAQIISVLDVITVHVSYFILSRCCVLIVVQI